MIPCWNFYSTLYPMENCNLFSTYGKYRQTIWWGLKLFMLFLLCIYVCTYCILPWNAKSLKDEVWISADKRIVSFLIKLGTYIYQAGWIKISVARNVEKKQLHLFLKIRIIETSAKWKLNKLSSHYSVWFNLVIFCNLLLKWRFP